MLPFFIVYFWLELDKYILTTQPPVLSVAIDVIGKMPGTKAAVALAFLQEEFVDKINKISNSKNEIIYDRIHSYEKFCEQCLRHISCMLERASLADLAEDFPFICDKLHTTSLSEDDMDIESDCNVIINKTWSVVEKHDDVKQGILKNYAFNLLHYTSFGYEGCEYVFYFERSSFMRLAVFEMLLQLLTDLEGRNHLEEIQCRFCCVYYQLALVVKWYNDDHWETAQKTLSKKEEDALSEARHILYTVYIEAWWENDD